MVNRNFVLALLGFVLIFGGFGSAAVDVTFDAYSAVIENDGSVSHSTNSVSGFAVEGYVCSNADCSVVGQKVSGLTRSTSGSSVVVSYPTSLLSSYGYVLYFYKDGYIGMERVGDTIHGTGAVDGPDVYLYKKRTGFAPIMNLNVVNEVSEGMPVEVGVSVGVDADTYAAIEDARTSNVALQESVLTRVSLKIVDEDGRTVYASYKDVSVSYSGSESVSFRYDGFSESGDYEFIVFSDVIDSKVLNSVKQSASSEVEVLEVCSEDDYWYTTISGLEFSPALIDVGEEVSFEFDYVSGYVDDCGLDSYVRTSTEVEIFRNGVLIDEDAYLLGPGRGTKEFSKTFDVAGSYEVVVKGFAYGASGDIVDSVQRVSFVVRPLPEIECSVNSQCGVAYFGNRYCSGDDVYRWYFVPTCNNAGTVDSYCSYENSPSFVSSCEFGCFLGVCLADDDLDDDGYTTDDCDDNNPNVNPGMTEVCGNGVDDDCDGLVDEGCDVACSVNLDCGGAYFFGGDNYCSLGDVVQDFVFPRCENAGEYDSYCSYSVVLPRVVEECSFGCFLGVCLADDDLDDDGYTTDDCDDSNPNVNPGMTEVCGNGIDDDCDGLVDEGCSVDNDGDGYTSDVDCNDNDSSIHPGASEVCGNDVDENCDGVVAECGDFTAPESVSNLRASDVSYYEIFWEWENPSDDDFALNLIYIDGENVLNTSNDFYDAVGLDDDTSYEIVVYTMDGSSNVNWDGVRDRVRTLDKIRKSGRDNDDGFNDDVPVYFSNDSSGLLSGNVFIDLDGPAKVGNEFVDDLGEWAWLVLLLLGIVLIMIFLVGFIALLR